MTKFKSTPRKRVQRAFPPRKRIPPTQLVVRGSTARRGTLNAVMLIATLLMSSRNRAMHLLGNGFNH
jgi:hypothetical protein